MNDKCQLCKKAPAEIRCIIVVGGEKIERHLCTECARKAGLAEQQRLNSKTKGRGKGIKEEKSDVFCSVCKTSFSQFVRTGLLGCPACYESFDRLLGDILKGIHSATYHKGRGPGEGRTIDIAQLRWKLSEAVEAEDFERAARLRDEIKRIERGTN